MAITANDLRKGMIIKFENDLCQVVEVEFIRPGNWRAMAQTKLRNLKTGAIFQQRFQTTEKIDEAEVETRNMQYLYKSDNNFYFMDIQSYEQFEIPQEIIGDDKKFLKEQMDVIVKMYDGKAIAIELPAFVELKVIDTPPNVRGNTASGGGKPATLEGGHVTTVPFFIEIGDIIKVDTRTGEYLERVNK